MKEVFYIVIRGPLACGKSSVSQELANKLGAEYICVDNVIMENNLAGEKDEGYISRSSFLKANELIVSRIKDFFRKGKPVIIDGNFYWKVVLDDLITKLKYPHQVFTLKARVETCISRDRERGETHGADAVRAVHEKVSTFDYGETIETDGKNIQEVVAEVLGSLGR